VKELKTGRFHVGYVSGSCYSLDQLCHDTPHVLQIERDIPIAS